MITERFTFRGDRTVSPALLRHKLAEKLGPSVDVSHDGTMLNFEECGLGVFLAINGTGDVVGAIADFSCVQDVQHVVATYKAFQELGWSVDDSS
jgi:hypothetical protein